MLFLKNKTQIKFKNIPLIFFMISSLTALLFYNMITTSDTICYFEYHFRNFPRQYDVQI